ncbi:hypothetical protein KB20921_18230 [Edwardsiella ictaluri]|nr:hypothetical protein KH20906_17980 [Edwardsiella ictaluri]BEI02562.1 hypothetical protein KB20921_18230 [Edwardsiella ictaluri]BEI06029.1 hypothetical protein KH201010_18150 [Edwardsiella ictaluri]BEI09484.1 hypothetical protein STU22726_18150 [Edwardsiella ictaluri]BEI12964.1 hypothetical protein STU22816_18170 [Edwardsiella ictaluri]
MPLHAVELGDIGLFERGGLLAGETHDQKDKAVFGHFVGIHFPLIKPRLCGYYDGRKVGRRESWGTFKVSDLFQNVFMLLAKKIGNGNRCCNWMTITNGDTRSVLGEFGSHSLRPTEYFD